MLRVLALSVLASTYASAEDAAPTAAECITLFTTAEETTCDSIAAFAQCLASSDAPPGDTFLVRGERVLAKAQEEKPLCSLEVSPSFKVVNREVR